MLLNCRELNLYPEAQESNSTNLKSECVQTSVFPLNVLTNNFVYKLLFMTMTRGGTEMLGFAKTKKLRKCET